MGISCTVTIPSSFSMDTLLQKLQDTGSPVQLAMLDGKLVHPTVKIPNDWRDLRLRGKAGMVSLQRSDNSVDVVVFGNADEALIALQNKIAALLQEG